MKDREKPRMPRPDHGQLELPVEPKPRRVLDLESLARLHRDFAARAADRSRAARTRHRTWRRRS